MKGYRLKVIAIVLAGVMVLSGALIFPRYAQAKKGDLVVREEGAAKDYKTQSSYGASPLTKNETVYVKLAPDGGVQNTTVVNWLHYEGEHPDTLTDPVQLLCPTPLNGDFKAKAVGDAVRLEGLDPKEQDFFYSGQSDKSLPERFEITYYLDGKEIEGKDLAGKSGNLRMVVKVHNLLSDTVTLKYEGGSETKRVYTPLVNMISVDLPIEKFAQVKAEGGMMTVIGQTMKVNWMLFPYPEAEAVLIAKVEDFALDGMTIVVQPQMPPLTEVDIENRLKDMDSGLAQLDSAMAELEQGAQSLSIGQKQMQEGYTAISSGIDKLVLLNKAQNLIIEAALSINGQILDAVSPLTANPLFGEKAKVLVAGLQKQKDLLNVMLKGGNLEGQELPPMSITSDKLTEMKEGLNRMAEGTEAAAGGADRIADGIKRVRTEGIAPIKAGVNEALKEAKSAEAEKKAIEERVKSYDTFLGKPDGAEARVQFVFKTEEIGE